MKRRSPAEKLAKKRHLLCERTSRALQVSIAEAEQLLTVPRQQSVRLNPLQANPASTLQAMKALGWHGRAYSWLQNGYSIEAGGQALRDSPLVTNGALFIQNASSWLPVLALQPQPGEHILDVCAAPGGKTSHIAALTNNQAHIIANDNSRRRLIKLQQNCQRLNAQVMQFTLFDGTQLAQKLPRQQFDKILLDAPCSGEGLLQLTNDKDIATWSVAHIKRLQQLQKRLLFQAWQLLKPGGTLVYSTCTIAPEENELVVQHALKTMPGCTLLPTTCQLKNRAAAVLTWNNKPLNPQLTNCLRLQPSQNSEAFFVARLQKATSDANT